MTLEKPKSVADEYRSRLLEIKGTSQKTLRMEHLIGATLFLMMGAVTWTGATLIDLYAYSRTQGSQIEDIRGNLGRIEALLNANAQNRYSASEAARDQARVDSRMNVLEQRLNRLEVTK